MTEKHTQRNPQHSEKCSVIAGNSKNHARIQFMTGHYTRVASSPMGILRIRIWDFLKHGLGGLVKDNLLECVWDMDHLGTTV
jgi:hypothetical protein